MTSDVFNDVIDVINDVEGVGKFVGRERMGSTCVTDRTPIRTTDSLRNQSGLRM